MTVTRFLQRGPASTLLPFVSTACVFFSALQARAQVVQSATLRSPNAQQRGHFGLSVTSVGDVNQDGVSDFAVGAPGETVGDSSSAGRVYLMSGTNGSLLRTLQSPRPQEDGEFGKDIAAAGDLNGDGIPDVLVGAGGEAVDNMELAGRAYLMSGADGNLLQTLTSPNAQADGVFGKAVARTGDVNGDGTPDLLVGAYVESADDIFPAGRSYVFSGADGEVLQRLKSPTPEKDGQFGWSVASVGDVNSDGTPDLLVGARSETADGSARAGRAYVFDGSKGRVLRALESPNAKTGGNFGGAVAGGEDVSGDGTPDLIVGADREDVSKDRRGRAYLFAGAKGTLIQTIELDQSDGEARFGASGGLGASVAYGHDYNQDGTPDLIIGAPRAGVKGEEKAGRVYLMSGQDGIVLQDVISPNPEGFKPGIMSGRKGGRFGASVARCGDLNGDGLRDLVVGAYGETVNGSDAAGRVYVLTSENSR